MKWSSFTALAVVSLTICPATQSIAETPAPAVAAPKAEQARPNVLVWMLDDVGFAQLSCYGGLVDTPNIDRVAAMGLRYSNYHTAPICSASRAAMLTGRNPHSVHVGGHAGAPRPFPGYDGSVPANAGTIAANMHAAGYTTFALGKWDHLPTREVNPAGPFNHWPTGQGFDRFYGFLSADADNWDPLLIRDTSPIQAPNTSGYHLNKDLADQALAMIASLDARDQKPPFFMYFATGTAHAPHHAPKDWIERYKGKFDMGWDKAREEILTRQIAAGLVPASTRLAPRPDGMPAWDSLSATQKRLYARQMEVFAASLSYADAEFGRILDALKKSGELDNTIIVITSDNGASAEGAIDGSFNEVMFVNGRHPNVEQNMRYFDDWGGPKTYPHYSYGWAVAGDTPFRYYKQTTHEGGTHVPLIMAWPDGIKGHGELRDQFVYVADLAPTLMEMADVQPADIVNNVKQRPMEGLSFRYTLNDASAAGRKHAQYFEMYGNKGLWSDGWTIVTTHRTKMWDMTKLDTPPNEPWELYDISKDPGQTTDLASRYPDKVKALSRLFDEQARKFNVYPIGNVSEAFPFLMQQRKEERERRGGKWVFSGPVGRMAELAGPPTLLWPFHLTASLDLNTGKETGPIYVQGGLLGGMGLYLKAGVPTFMLRDFDGQATVVSASEPLPAGPSTVELGFLHKPGIATGPQDIDVSLKINGRPVAAKTVRFAIPFMFSVNETLDIGIDYGKPLTTDYAPGQRFPGKIEQLIFDFNSKQ
jgi:arylsulfatase